jgi:hypothetical protein
MVAAVKQDSNVTGLRYAEEDSLKTLSGDEIWQPLEPNSYNDFGGQFALVARNPINRNRQRKKGVITDLDASGGFNNDLTAKNLRDLLQGFFFADIRKKGEEKVNVVDIDAGNPDEYEVASTTGFLVNDLIFGSGFTNANNNGLKLVTAIVGNTSVEVATGSLTAEGSPPAAAKINVVGHQFTTGELSGDFTNGAFPALVSGTLDLTTLGLVPGELIFIGDDTNAAFSFADPLWNGWARVFSVTSTRITLDKTDSVITADDAGTGKTIRIYYGSVLKNETGALIKRRTYSLERTLGVPDTASSNEQGEYLDGSVPSQIVVNVPQADKINCDISFVSCDYQTVTAGNLRGGTRPAVEEADAFNTSTDFSLIKLALASDTDAAVTPLVAYMTDLTLTISNNVQPNKALGVVGAFEVNAGNFTVDGAVTGYFADVAAVSAVRNNSDVTFSIIAAKRNQGIAIDVPLIALGDGRLQVEQDQPIRLPLTMAAAEHPTYHHTALMCFYDYLPSVAEV